MGMTSQTRVRIRGRDLRDRSFDITKMEAAPHMNAKLIAAVTLASFTLAFAARAQEADYPKDIPAWVEHVGEQLGNDLTSSSPAIRQQAMQHIAHFAYFYGEGLDLSATVPNLLATYRGDADERSRLFALAALHAIGDEEAMQEIRQHVWSLDDEASSRVQLVTLAALMQYYGEDTFAGDEEAAGLAKSLLDYYTGPRVLVEPPTVVEP